MKFIRYLIALAAILAIPVIAQQGGGGVPNGSPFSTQYRNGNFFGGTGPGTSGQVLTSRGAGLSPTFQAVSAGSVTSVGLTMPGIFSVTGSPVTSSGTLAVAASGTSGGIPYFSSPTTLASSAAFTAHGVLIAGAPANPPVSTTAGTAGQVLTSNGASADPTFQSVGGGTPGGSDTQIQFNDAGAFGGDADYTWTKATNLLVLGSTATPGTIRGGPGTAANGATLKIFGGAAGTTNAGGILTLEGGPGGATSGNSAGVNINSGTVTDGDAGSIFITGRDGVGTSRAGGAISGTAGNSTTAVQGANVSWTAGNGGPTGNGGTVTLKAGNGGATSGGGGDVILTPGTATAGSVGGKINSQGAIAITGTKFTASGCSNSTTVGGAAAGSYNSGTTGTCTVTVTLPTVPNAYACHASNVTTTANAQSMTASTSTSATFSGTTNSGDVIKFMCIGY